MNRGHITLEHPERFSGEYNISNEKLNRAIGNAVDKLYINADRYAEGFPKVGRISDPNNNLKYELGKCGNWTHGMHTGCYLLAYELTGDEKFLNVAEQHISHYEEIVANRHKELTSHDVGFLFSPSTVAYYKITGDKRARRISLDAARHILDFSYSQEGGFIARLPGSLGDKGGCRTMVDTLLNIPLLYWAWEETGIRGYLNMANSQVGITDEYLVREDASTNHHYQFEPYTYKPLGGVTLQGASDASCWSRGHSWVVCGLPIAYSYNCGDGVGYLQTDRILKLHRDVTYFALNHLPEDNIPYWDYDFVSGDEPRDTSVGVINACGMLEAVKYLDDSAEEKGIYKNASAKSLEAVIDKYTGEFTNKGKTYDGLLWGCTGSKPHNLVIEGCALYGDYFYLEALLRFKKPNWIRYW